MKGYYQAFRESISRIARSCLRLLERIAINEEAELNRAGMFS